MILCSHTFGHINTYELGLKCNFFFILLVGPSLRPVLQEGDAAAHYGKSEGEISGYGLSDSCRD